MAPLYSRRALVRGLLAGGGAAVAIGLVREHHRRAPAPAPAPAPTSALSPERRSALGAAQERLLPSEPGAPGARDVRAVDYLAAATGDPHTDPGDVQLLLEGADDLDAAARERFGAAFAALPPDRQDDLLREGLADEDQAEFLALLLAFTLEALLCDPVYGGNPEGRGWSWLAIPAPTPRPPRPYALDAT